jgi:hypothetical protein
VHHKNDLEADGRPEAGTDMQLKQTLPPTVQAHLIEINHAAGSAKRRREACE